MIVIDAPDTPFRPMQLIGEKRSTRGGIAPLELASRIELSEPLVIVLNKQPVGEDHEMEAFLAANKGQFRYDYVRLGCTFAPHVPERFEKAWLKVILKPKEGSATPLPISISISPLNEYDLIEEGTSVKIGVPGKIVTAEAGANTKLSKKLYTVKGFCEGGPNPYWELNNNQVSSLEGILRFHMIVRSPANCITVGEVRLEAVISNRVFVAFRQQRPFDQSPSQVFQLVPA